MKIICKLCGKQIKGLMSEHCRIWHKDYNWPKDWTQDGGDDE